MLLVPAFSVLPYLHFQPRGLKEHYSHAHECTVFNTGNFSHSVDNFASCGDALDSSNASVKLQWASCCNFPSTAGNTHIATNKFSFCLKLLPWSRPPAFPFSIVLFSRAWRSPWKPLFHRIWEISPSIKFVSNY